MEFDLNKRYCYYFNEITKIPHPSFHEEKIAAWIVQFAKDHGFEWKEDDMHNVIVYKPATAGYEDSPLLGLQAHIDMVAEKWADVEHDFLNDPLKTYVDEEGWLHASGTTLGADDGVGVAYMLAILDSTDIPHPALECMFTVQEEVGLCGALHLTKDLVKSHRVINLDGGGEYVTAVSSAGGCCVYCTIEPEYIANEKKTYSLLVDGLEGGHSGGNIHKEKGNACKLVVRILKEMELAGAKFNLASITGGAKMNAISRASEAIITTDMTLDEIAQAVSKSVKDIKTELEFSDPGFNLTVKEIDKVAKTMDEASSKKAINFMYLLPNGFRHRSMAIEGLTLTSLNFGILEMVDGNIKITTSIRSALDSGVSHLVETITTLGDVLGVKVEANDYYPGWNYKKDSALRDLMNKAVNEQYGRDIVTIAGHGGCECGVFCAMYEDMDIIGVGAKSYGVHTPEEKLDLASFDRAFKLLCRIIELCK